MKLVSQLRHTSVIHVSLVLILLGTSIPFHVLAYTNKGEKDPYACTDLALVFARGSGQNPDHKSIESPFTNDFNDVEKESHAFFNQFKARLDGHYPNVDYKAVSIHDFPGKYSPVGYRAVEVGHESIQKINNSVNGELFWAAGSYRASVEQGIIETVGYIKDQINDCPNQSIVVGGYSQGAQVMGESLFRLSESERSKIVGVGLFGDPKYIGSSGDDLLNPLDKSVSYPWRRGTATNNDRGMLDARIPYLPQDIERRATSWCFARDIVCSGYSARFGNATEAHSSYSQNPMSDTVNELMQWAAPSLAEAERRNGGFGSGPVVPYDPTPAQLAKTRDVMFLLNDGSGDSVLYTFRYGVDAVLDPITRQFTNTQYGAKGFGEGQTGTTNLPRVNNIQALQPYVGYDPAKPGQTLSNFARSINARYPFAQPHMGGGDFADPHGLAVERSVFSGGWRAEAEKHLVLITDRAPKVNYTYNICHATVRSWLQITQTDGNLACNSKIGTDSWPKVLHPEVCETAYLAVTSETCTNPIKTPGYVQNINRSLEDAVRVAQSQNIYVSVVVPHKITDQYNVNNIPDMMKNLRYLAEATGGKFINYDQRTGYSGVLLSDTLRQIFTHEPKSLIASYQQAYNNREATGKGTAEVATNAPVILDVSQSGAHYDEYKWDHDDNGTWDQVTEGPVAEVVYESPYSGFTKVLGINTDGSTAQTNIAVAATTQPISNVPVIPSVPEVTGSYNAYGSLTLTWSGDQDSTLLFVDPESKLPVVSTRTLNGTLTFMPEQQYPQLLVYALTDDAISEAYIVSPQLYVPPIDEVTEPILVTDDPTICYKLQTCPKETSPSYETPQVAVATNIATIIPLPQVQGAGTPQTTLANSTPEFIEDNFAAPQVAAATTATSQGKDKSPSNISASVAPSDKSGAWLKLLAMVLVATGGIASVVAGLRKYQQP